MYSDGRSRLLPPLVSPPAATVDHTCRWSRLTPAVLYNLLDKWWRPSWNFMCWSIFYFFLWGPFLHLDEAKPPNGSWYLGYYPAHQTEGISKSPSSLCDRRQQMWTHPEAHLKRQSPNSALWCLFSGSVAHSSPLRFPLKYPISSSFPPRICLQDLRKVNWKASARLGEARPAPVLAVQALYRLQSDSHFGLFSAGGEKCHITHFYIYYSISLGLSKCLIVLLLSVCSGYELKYFTCIYITLQKPNQVLVWALKNTFISSFFNQKIIKRWVHFACCCTNLVWPHCLNICRCFFLCVHKQGSTQKL